MDRLTHEGLTTGAVTLPRRPMHVGVWLRLLRTLLDEVSISASCVRRHSVAALKQICDARGMAARAGPAVLRPYEMLDLPRQDAMLEAAASALAITRAGRIIARGDLGPLLTSQPHQSVYDGDWPGPAEVARAAKREAMRRSWPHAQQELEVWFEACPR